MSLSKKIRIQRLSRHSFSLIVIKDSKCKNSFTSLLQHSLEQAENLIKQHEAFITTMDANDEKINNVLQFAQRLIDENHYAADKVQQKADNINER